MFVDHRSHGSKALLQNEFLTAINQYDSAIECMERLQNTGVSILSTIIVCSRLFQTENSLIMKK